MLPEPSTGSEDRKAPWMGTGRRLLEDVRFVPFRFPCSSPARDPATCPDEMRMMQVNDSHINWLTALVSALIELVSAVVVPSMIWSHTSDVQHVSAYFLGCAIGLTVALTRSSSVRALLDRICHSIRSRRV